MEFIKFDGRILVTALLEPERAPAQALDRLYAMRWNIEVGFRTTKGDIANGCAALQIKSHGRE